MKCKLEFLYYLTRPAAANIAPHSHGCYELVYYVSGTGATNIDGTDYTFAPNTFSVIQPNTSHDERRKEDNNVLFIGFHCSNPPAALENGLYRDIHQNRILRILQRIKEEMLEKKAFYELKLEAHLQDLVVEVIRADSENVEPKRGLPYIEKFLQENFAHEIDFDILAEISGYSYHRFRHVFKELYGFSPHQYVIRLRLMNAANMLRSTQYSVLRVAQENGFASQSQFCSLFRRMYGCTAGEFRENGKQPGNSYF